MPRNTGYTTRSQHRPADSHAIHDLVIYRPHSPHTIGAMTQAHNFLGSGFGPNFFS